MADSSLPVEILEVIFEDLILEFTKEAEGGTFVPRWYLLPLLQVCKLWHLVCERYLYRSISLGNRFPDRWTEPIEGPQTLVPARKPHMTTYALIVKLKGNSRLATLVEELHLHWQLHYIDNVSINLLIISICPNLQHVDLRSVSSFEIGILSEALAEKSLVSLRIHVLTGIERTSFPIVNLMQRWPKIRSIRVEGRYGPISREDLHDFEASAALNRCPELREIILTRGSLREKELTSLRRMCSVVTKLDVCFTYSCEAAFDALCGCLHSWSPTLESCSIRMGAMPSSYPPLSVALSSLTHLQELKTYNFHVDFDAISSLPQLKRLYHTVPLTDMVMDRLASHLESPEKFTALTYIEIYGQNRGWKRILRDACRMRNIVLEM